MARRLEAILQSTEGKKPRTKQEKADAFRLATQGKAGDNSPQRDRQKQGRSVPKPLQK